MNRITDRPARLPSPGWVGLFLLLLLAVTRPASAAVVTIATNASAASTDSGEIDTGGGHISVQFCGGTGADAFSGSFVVNQGAATGKLVPTYSSGTITGLDGCSATYHINFQQNVNPFTRIVITRTAGKYSAWLVWNAK